MVECPLCGKECSNYFYLGQHVGKGKPCVELGNSKPKISETISDSSGTNDVSPGEQNSSSSSGSSSSEDFWEEDDQEDQSDGWRKLDSSDPMEAEKLAEGYKEINMDRMEVR